MALYAALFTSVSILMLLVIYHAYQISELPGQQAEASEMQREQSPTSAHHRRTRSKIFEEYTEEHRSFRQKKGDEDNTSHLAPTPSPLSIKLAGATEPLSEQDVHTLLTIMRRLRNKVTPNQAEPETMDSFWSAYEALNRERTARESDANQYKKEHAELLAEIRNQLKEELDERDENTKALKEKYTQRVQDYKNSEIILEDQLAVFKRLGDRMCLFSKRILPGNIASPVRDLKNWAQNLTVRPEYNKFQGFRENFIILMNKIEDEVQESDAKYQAKANELEDANNKISSMDSDLVSAKEEIEKQKGDLAIAQSCKDDAEKQLGAKDGIITTKDAGLRKVNADLTDLRNQLSSAEMDNKKKDEKIAMLGEKLAAANQKLQTTSAESNERLEKVLDSEKKKSEAHEELEAKYNKQLEELQNSKDELVKAADSQKKHDQETDDLKSQLKALQEASKTSVEKEKDLQAQMKALQDAKDEQAKERDDAQRHFKEKEELKLQVEQLRETNNTFAIERNKLESRVLELQATNAKQGKKLKNSVEEAKQKHSAEIMTLTASHATELTELKDELSKRDSKLETAGNELRQNAALHKDLEGAKTEIAKLKEAQNLLNQERDELKAIHDDAIRKAEDSCKKEEQAKQEHSQELARIKKIHADELEKARNQLKQTMVDDATKAEELEREVRSQRKELNAVKSAKDEAIAELEASRKTETLVDSTLEEKIKPHEFGKSLKKAEVNNDAQSGIQAEQELESEVANSKDDMHPKEEILSSHNAEESTAEEKDTESVAEYIDVVATGDGLGGKEENGSPQEEAVVFSETDATIALPETSVDRASERETTVALTEETEPIAETYPNETYDDGQKGPTPPPHAEPDNKSSDSVQSGKVYGEQPSITGVDFPKADSNGEGGAHEFPQPQEPPPHKKAPSDPTAGVKSSDLPSQEKGNGEFVLPQDPKEMPKSSQELLKTVFPGKSFTMEVSISTESDLLLDSRRKEGGPITAQATDRAPRPDGKKTKHCGRCFKDIPAEEFEAHIAKHPPFLRKCDICGEHITAREKSAHSLKCKIENGHMPMDDQGRIECRYCGKWINERQTPGAFEEHHKRCIKSKEETKCICGFTIPMKSTDDAEVSLHATTCPSLRKSTRSIECKNCHRTFFDGNWFRNSHLKRCKAQGAGSRDRQHELHSRAKSPDTKPPENAPRAPAAIRNLLVASNAAQALRNGQSATKVSSPGSDNLLDTAPRGPAATRNQEPTRQGSTQASNNPPINTPRGPRVRKVPKAKAAPVFFPHRKR